MKTFKDYLAEVEKKTQTKTKDKTDWSNLDDIFKSASDQPLAKAKDEPKDQEPAADEPSDRRTKSSQSDTLRAASRIAPNDRMRDLLGRMRDIEADDDDLGYPAPDEPETLPSTEVNTKNLPAVAGQALQAAGVQDPKFHKVANLPGNMSRAIRTLGKQLFRSFTRTPTEDIWMLGNLGGQGPNTAQEINAVAGWARENGERVSTGDIDFDTSIPGYSADITQFSAQGIRWLLVQDEFGRYVYSWPESDSLDSAAEPARLTDR